MFPPNQINRELITRFLYQKLAEIPELGTDRVLLENPSKKAKFPACILYNFQARPKYFKSAYALSITVEIWADQYYQAQSLYDKVVEKLAEYNFAESGATPQGKDIVTGKQRYGGTFEAGWNAIENTLYVNRS